MVFQVMSEKPPHMLELPGPGIVSPPSLLNGRLHYAGLPQMALLRGLRAGQDTAQEQRHIERRGHARPPM